MRHRYLPLICLLLALFLPLHAAEPAAVPTPTEASAPVIDEGARVENPPETLELAYRFEKGQVNKYQVLIMNRGKFRLLNQKEESDLNTITEMFFRQSIKDEQDKLFTVIWSLLSGVVRIPGFGQSVMTLPELTYSMDDHGTVHKVLGLDKLALLPGKPQQKSFALTLGQLRFQGFPKRALKVGDEWTRDCAIDLSDNEKIPIKVTSKLIGYEHYDKWDCAKIESSFSYPIKLTIEDKVTGKLTLEGKESGRVVARFAYKEGKMIRTEGDVTSEAKVIKADGKPTDAYVSLQLNIGSTLIADTTEPAKEGK